jgi:hypothetical protein
MRFVKGARSWLGLLGVLAFGLTGCENGGSGDTGAGASFALTECDSSAQCGEGFECAAFPCPADCADAADGRCDTCQVGALCLPQPPTECDPGLCGPGEVCQRSCSGACDLAVGQCYDVACQVTCLPVGTPTEPDPEQACVTDFTDACLPPDYPVAARLDEVCAAQGLVLTDVSVAAECWPGAVQFKWTCCRGEDPSWPVDPGEPMCRRWCDENGACYEECCDPATGECWGTEPQPPHCYVECDAAGQCYDVCCDPNTGACWGGPYEPPTHVCVERGYDECFPEGVDIKERAWADCADQNLELIDLKMAYECGDGLYAYTWTCCGGAVQPPTEPEPTECRKECYDDGTCVETCCDASGQCWTTSYPGEPQPPDPTDPDACIGLTAGGDNTCTDLETLLAYASWTCAASGLLLADSGPWGECDGGYQGLKYLCCP